MKVKLSWIPFVLFTPVLIGLALYTSIFPDSDQLFMGFGVSILPYAVAGVTLLMFLLCFLLKAIDRKTADYYVIKRNIPAGLFGLITAASVAAEGGISLLKAKTAGNISAYDVVYVVFTLLAALAIVIMSLMHLTKSTNSKGLSVYLLMPSIWSAVKLVNVFVNNAEISLANTDVIRLLTLIAITLYLFFYAQLISCIRSKGTVKNTIIMGLMSVALLLASSSVPVYEMVNTGTIPDIFSLIPVVQNIAFILYIFSFIAEVSSQALRKDEIRVAGSDEDFTEVSDNSDKKKEKKNKKNKENLTETEAADVYSDESAGSETVREQIEPSDFEDMYSEYENVVSNSENIADMSYAADIADIADIGSKSDDVITVSDAVISEIEKENQSLSVSSDDDENAEKNIETVEDTMRRIDQLIFQLETDDNNV